MSRADIGLRSFADSRLIGKAWPTSQRLGDLPDPVDNRLVVAVPLAYGSRCQTVFERAVPFKQVFGLSFAIGDAIVKSLN